MEVRTFSNPAVLADQAARDCLALAADAIAARGRWLVALSGGSTPRDLFRRVADLGPSSPVDWSRVVVFWSDERSVPPDHPDSNYRMARETLLAPLGIDDAQVHRMRAEAEDIEAAAREYEQVLAEATGAVPGHSVPCLDLVLLGLGPDGHTASLFADTVALDVRDRWVVRNYVAKFVSSRLTLTFPVIHAAREIRVLVAGAAKAKTLAAVLHGPRDPDRLPAQRLADAHGRVVWLVDEAAAASLQDR
jgi:6-phosphogluconolactonase